MRSAGKVLLPLLLLMAWVLGSHAESASSAFDSANQLFEQGRFTEAAAAFGKLAQSGQTSEALYFNLGNAWFKANQLGRAIAAFKQAERIAPRDPDLRANSSSPASRSRARLWHGARGIAGSAG